MKRTAEFWDTHHTTDYSDSFESVVVEAELKRRRYEVEIDEELMRALTEQAQKTWYRCKSACERNVERKDSSGSIIPSSA